VPRHRTPRYRHSSRRPSRFHGKDLPNHFPGPLSGMRPPRTPRDRGSRDGSRTGFAWSGRETPRRIVRVARKHQACSALITSNSIRFVKNLLSPKNRRCRMPGNKLLKTAVSITVTAAWRLSSSPHILVRVGYGEVAALRALWSHAHPCERGSWTHGATPPGKESGHAPGGETVPKTFPRRCDLQSRGHGQEPRKKARSPGNGCCVISDRSTLPRTV